MASGLSGIGDVRSGVGFRELRWRLLKIPGSIVSQDRS